MLITEIRNTNCTITAHIFNKLTNYLHSEAADYNDIIIEYSNRHNNLTTNIDEAVIRYSIGCTEPLVYRYYTGTKIDNTSKLR